MRYTYKGFHTKNRSQQNIHNIVNMNVTISFSCLLVSFTYMYTNFNVCIIVIHIEISHSKHNIGEYKIKIQNNSITKYP